MTGFLKDTAPQHPIFLIYDLGGYTPCNAILK